MSLSFYLIFAAACCIFTIGINGQPPIGAGTSPPPPQNLYLCPYSPTYDCSSVEDYRNIDASCSDKDSPYFGKSETPYVRIVSSMYMGNSTPRNVSLFGAPLPWPRTISNVFFKSDPYPPTDLTVMAPTFARFVEHDLYKTKLMKASSCCTPMQGSGVCYNIRVSPSDPYFSTYNRICLPKGKIVSSTKLDCTTGGPPQQINENTHTLDLSNIYGSTTTDSDRLRTKTDGLLKVTDTKDLLPKYALQDCVLPSPNPNDIHCFDAGDLRVNTDPLIMTMYTIWVRHHNAIAKQLKLILKDANDEKIYNETRKVVIGHYQHIVYNELLPVFDKNTPLKPTSTGTSSHDATFRPIIINSFSLMYTAIIDSMVPEMVKIDTVDVPLDKVYYKPDKLFETDGIKKMLEAMQVARADNVDRFMAKSLRDSYLQVVPGYGTDKVALNLQQSRENGAPAYEVFYRVLHIDWDGQLSEIDTSITDLRELYKDDIAIELLPGLFSEYDATDAVYGKTTQLLMNKQFKALKEGDRFFYSHAGVFKTEQFEDIKKITLARIICNNSPLTSVRPLALKTDVAANTHAPCTLIPDMNICLWATGWTEWKSNGCYHGIHIYTRQCSILSGSACTCNGSPVKYEPCVKGPFQNLVIGSEVTAINETYYEYYDVNGKPVNENNTSNFIEILTEKTP